MPAIGRVLDRVLEGPKGEPWLDSAAWYNPHTGRCRVSVGDAVGGYDKVRRAVEEVVGAGNVDVCDECAAPAGEGWLRVIEQEGKAAAACCPKCGAGCPIDAMPEEPFPPHKECPKCGEVPAVVKIREVIRYLPPLMPGYGDVYYNPAKRKVFVVCGDSDERGVIDRWRKALLRVDGVDEYDGEAEYVRGEIGTLAEAKPPWIKVAAPASTSTLPDGRVLDIDALNGRAEGRPVERIPIGDLGRPDRSSKTGFSRKRLAAVDMEKPILVGPDGTLHDGRHRLIRHLEAGHTHVPARRVTHADLAAVTIREGGRPSGDRIDESRVGLLPAKAAMLRAIIDNMTVPEKSAASAALVTALLPGRRRPVAVVAPRRRRPVAPAVDPALAEAAAAEALLPQLRARRLALARRRAALARAPVKVAAADYAPGLPRKRDFGDLSRLSPGQLLTYVVQHHKAHRAGPHHDVRIGSPAMGLHSWAVPRGLPPPGEKHLAVHQPVHRHSYRKFEGEIPRGAYGAGSVRKVDEGQVLITKAGPDHVHFTLAHRRHPERFVLVRPRGFGRPRDWLLANVTPAGKVPFEKLHYKRVPAEQIEDAIRTMGEGGSVEAKVDGASQLVQLLRGHAEHFSYRTSKETGRPIVHTERVFGGRPTFDYPPHLEGSVLKGELHAAPTTTGRFQPGIPGGGGHGDRAPAPQGAGGGQFPAGAGAGDGPIRPERHGGPLPVAGPQDVATLLNSSVARSLQLQREQGVKIRNMLYDIQQYGRTPVGVDVPRAERRRMLAEVAGHLPGDTFHLSGPVHTPAEGIEMLRQIRSGRHPLTQEGVVIHPAQGVPLKGKLTDEHLVHVTGTFPGEGKRSQTVGGFTYGHAPGRTVGRVGSGFGDEFLREVARDPGAYVGRLARVRAQERLPSGALRAPVFLGLHEDYNKIPGGGTKAAGLTEGMLAAARKMPDTYGPEGKPSWTKHVMTHYDSTKPPGGIFARSADEIVAAGRDPGVAPLGLGSWQKMVIFHRNRGGARLGEERRAVLQDAITRLSEEIRKGREKASALLPSVGLQPQQRRVAERVNAYDPRVLVYHGLGSGKSLASIAAAEQSGKPYLAAVPAALRPNYQKELAKFTDAHTPSSVLSYTQVGQGARPAVAPDTLILDEAQRLRNPDSQATRGVMDLARQARRVVMLSGTPVVNGPSDLAVPASILGGEDITPKEFDRRFVGKREVSPGLMGWLRGVPPVKVPVIQHEDELEALFRGHVDYHPPKTPEGVRTGEERVEVDMSPRQRDFYRLMWNKLPFLTRWKMKNDYPMSAEELRNLQAFMTGPRQAALSLYPFQGEKDPYRAFQESGKLTRAFADAREVLAGNPRAKVIAYSNFIDAGLTPYEAALKTHGIPYSILHGKMNDAERKAQLDAYNSGRSRVLLYGPSSAEGISAQGTQLIQLLDPHWNQARMGQAQGRGLRFDSHEGLPAELRDVKTRRYISKMPDPGFLGRLFGGGPRPTADQFLEAQARRKEELNEQFRDVLRRVGSEPPTRPWWNPFG